LVSGDKDGSVNVFDLNSRNQIFKGKVHSDEVESIAFTSNGQLFATTGRDDSIKLFQINGTQVNLVHQWQNVFAQSGNPGVTSISITPDDRYLVCAGICPIVLVYDLQTKQIVSQVQTGFQAVYEVVVAPNGQHLFCSTRGGIKIFAFPSGQEVGFYQTNRAYDIISFAVSQDSNTVVFGEYNNDA